jgi:hypothetical protein
VPLGWNCTAASSWNAALASEMNDALVRLKRALVHYSHFLCVQISGSSSSSSNTQAPVWESFTPGLVKPLVLMLLELHLLASDAVLKLQALEAIDGVLWAAEAVAVHKQLTGDGQCMQELAACKVSLLEPVLQLLLPDVQQACSQQAAAASSSIPVAGGSVHGMHAVPPASSTGRSHTSSSSASGFHSNGNSMPAAASAVATERALHQVLLRLLNFGECCHTSGFAALHKGVCNVCSAQML